jgi:Yip1 domain
MLNLVINLFAVPGEVFDKIVVAPPRPANWVVPTLLACLAGIMLQQTITPAEHTLAALSQTAQSGALSSSQAAELAAGGPALSIPATIVAALAGTFWAAFVLWFIGRVFLRSQFSYLKALEVVGLSCSVMALGAIITVLLVAASGNSAARPALSLLVPSIHARAYAVLAAFDVFQLWTNLVLAIGLSKLSRVAFKEAAFWVFGYWLMARLTLILLA